LAERIIVVRNCPPPPVPNQAPTVAWVDSGVLAEPQFSDYCAWAGEAACGYQWINSTVAGFSCAPPLPDTKTLLARVSDDTTPVDQLKVNLVWMYGEVYYQGQITWLQETIGAAPMTHIGNGQYSFLVGPYAATRAYAVVYFISVEDADGAVVTTEAQLTGMYIYGCVELF
jgi:hypothetical protein